MNGPGDKTTDTGDRRAAVEAAKHAARAHARAARGGLEKAAIAAAAEAVAERLLALPELAYARVVLAYGASPEELDPSPAVSALRTRGVNIAYPRVEAPGVLGLHLVEEDERLERGMFGILEPGSKQPRVAREAIDAVIVPGVAFDEGCWRLGYGGGYYDRLLPTLRPDCARIGVAFDEQILASIPAQDHDVVLDAVVTPSRVLRQG